jgi:hypothetical protein
MRLSTGGWTTSRTLLISRGQTSAVVHRLWTTLGIMVRRMEPGMLMTGADDVHRLWIEETWT